MTRRICKIVAGQILRAYGVEDAYIYVGALVRVYAVLAIIAILRTPETKGTDPEVDAAAPYRSKRPLPVG